MAITIDGVTYRNLPEQVKENAENIEQLQADVVELQEGAKLKYLVVDELPETGESGIIYLVPLDDGEQPNIYEEYLWIEGEWEMIGTTAIDLTNYVTLDGSQYITGAKTFKDKILVTNGTEYGGQKVGFSIVNYGWVTYLGQFGGTEVCFDSTGFYSTNSIRTLGKADYFWGNTFTKQINFGTNIGGRVTSCYIDTDAYDGMRFYCNNAKVMALYDDGVYFDYKIIPNTTNTTDIGSTTKWWNDEYISGKILFKDKSGGSSRLWRLGNTQYGTLNVETSNDNGTTWAQRYAFQAGSFIPLVGNTVDLGYNNSNQRWKTLYLSNAVDLPNSSISENNDTSLVLSNSNGEVVFDNCVLSDGTNTVSIADLKALIDYAKGQGWIS